MAMCRQRVKNCWNLTPMLAGLLAVGAIVRYDEGRVDWCISRRPDARKWILRTVDSQLSFQQPITLVFQIRRSILYKFRPRNQQWSSQLLLSHRFWLWEPSLLLTMIMVMVMMIGTSANQRPSPAQNCCKFYFSDIPSQNLTIPPMIVPDLL